MGVSGRYWVLLEDHRGSERWLYGALAHPHCLPGNTSLEPLIVLALSKLHSP